MELQRIGLGFTLVAVVVASARMESEAAPTTRLVSAAKGGDDRSGPYDVVPGWWKPAPDHDETWTWGSGSGVWPDTPDRILVAMWGDQRRQGVEGEDNERNRNFVLAVDRNGNITENWSRWDSLFNRPHQIYVNPYDPERSVWVDERGGNGVHESILKFSNDGSELLLMLRDPRPVSGEEDEQGIVPPARVDGSNRIYVSDRRNHRVQVFDETGTHLDTWPDIWDPVAIMVDVNDAVWVLDATLNRILRYNLDGQLQDYFGTYGEASSLGRPGFTCSDVAAVEEAGLDPDTHEGACGGFSLPHQMSVDSEGNVYVAQFSGPWIDKYVPKADAEPSRLIGLPIGGP